MIKVYFDLSLAWNQRQFMILLSVLSNDNLQDYLVMV